MLSNYLSYIVICLCALVTLVSLYYIGVVVVETFKKKRKFNANGRKGVTGFLASLAIMGGLAYCMYHVPYILFYGLSWEVIEENGPMYVIYDVIAIAVAVSAFYLYFTLSVFFEKPNEKPLYMVIILSIVSGMGNSLIVFIINEALNRSSEALGDTTGYIDRSLAVETGLYLFFILGLLLFVAGAMFVRKKLISLTNSVIYDKRMEIVGRILKAPYHKFEAMDGGKTYAVLNNDTETVSSSVNMIVDGFTGIISLITCLVYLATLNLYGMLFSVAIITLASCLFVNAGRSAEKHFEKNRDAQNTFFEYIGALIGGFKELYINHVKQNEFHNDMDESCKTYRDTRIEGENRLVGVTVMGQVMYMTVIGIVVFTFPILFRDIQGSTLRTYVLVYLYMGGLVNMIVFQVPALIRLLVSWKRINTYSEELLFTEEEKQDAAAKSGGEFLLEFKNVKFQYKNEASEKFTVGPVNYEFRNGEIVFVSGGNGSGKSTLVKLITGLYPPDEGEITVNGEKTDSKLLGQYFSTVYSDFHLFDKLYGIDCEENRDKIQKYLEILRLADKVQVRHGAFNTIKLSTGQRKRLALLVSYLENRPAYLFDEWAADQDPEFRSFFYKTLLPDLKARGKAIIAVTHDDRYFGEADKLIKMENGVFVSRERPLEYVQ